MEELERIYHNFIRKITTISITPDNRIKWPRYRDQKLQQLLLEYDEDHHIIKNFNICLMIEKLDRNYDEYCYEDHVRLYEQCFINTRKLIPHDIRYYLDCVEILSKLAQVYLFKQEYEQCSEILDVAKNYVYAYHEIREDEYLYQGYLTIYGNYMFLYEHLGDKEKEKTYESLYQHTLNLFYQYKK